MSEKHAGEVETILTKRLKMNNHDIINAHLSYQFFFPETRALM